VAAHEVVAASVLGPERQHVAVHELDAATGTGRLLGSRRALPQVA
jgi:hypothetical protein